MPTLKASNFIPEEYAVQMAIIVLYNHRLCRRVVSRPDRCLWFLTLSGFWPGRLVSGIHLHSSEGIRRRCRPSASKHRCGGVLDRWMVKGALLLPLTLQSCFALISWSEGHITYIAVCLGETSFAPLCAWHVSNDPLALAYLRSEHMNEERSSAPVRVWETARNHRWLRLRCGPYASYAFFLPCKNGGWV